MTRFISLNKIRVSWLAAVILCLFAFSSCTASVTPEETTFFAMDTVMAVKLYGGEAAISDVTEKCRAEALSCENLFSTNIENSDVSKINLSAGVSTEVSPRTAELLSYALDMYLATEGAFDITVYPLVRLWGFSTGEYRLPEAEEISALLPVKGASCIDVDGCAVSAPAGTEIDLGGIAKGYLGDRLRGVLSECGVTSAVLSLGGNIVLVGDRPDGELWTVAVKNPDDTSSYYCTFSLPGGLSVVTSGGYERSFEKDGVTYHHIIDPATGSPAISDIISVTVIGENGAYCDALSTALFVMGSEKALNYMSAHDEYGYVILTQSKTVYSSLELTLMPGFTSASR